jgi:hypothetical protein
MTEAVVSENWVRIIVTGLTMMALSSAQAQQGPVATACSVEISKFCADKKHGQGEVRACLELNKDKVSPECKAALDTTGPGKGKGTMPSP